MATRPGLADLGLNITPENGIALDDLAHLLDQPAQQVQGPSR